VGRQPNPYSSFLCRAEQVVQKPPDSHPNTHKISECIGGLQDFCTLFKMCFYLTHQILLKNLPSVWVACREVTDAAS
jgi:hypothetical protein